MSDRIVQIQSNAARIRTSEDILNRNWSATTLEVVVLIYGGERCQIRTGVTLAVDIRRITKCGFD